MNVSGVEIVEPGEVIEYAASDETAQQSYALDHVDQYLQLGKESDASDIHLGVNSQPIWRRLGILEPIWLQAPKLTHRIPSAWPRTS